MQLTHEYTADVERRFKYPVIAAVILFLAVVARLYYLQIIKGSFYRFFSNENSIKEMKIPAARGMVFDRNGVLLIDNRPAYNIVIVPQYVADPPKTLASLQRLVGISEEELASVWAMRLKQPRYQPLVVKEDVSQDDVALIRAHKTPYYDKRDEYDLRGVEVDVHYRRWYPDADVATHALGYVKEIDPAKLSLYQSKYPGRYRMGDMIGIEGIEERWDLWLRGRDGFEEKIVNAVGRQVDYEGIASELEHRSAEGGKSLILTLDRKLQKTVRDAFGGRKGAAVAIDLRNGAIRVLFSAPSYDLNILSSPNGNAYWMKLSSDPRRSLLNRAIAGGYPPGSTYKVVTGLAALSEGVVKPEENVHCGGALFFGGRAYHCWADGGHGAVDFHRALVSSCDVYFYTMGLRLGVDRLAKFAQMLGLGMKTGVPINGEKQGLIPTSAWKEKRYGVPWQKGEDLSVAVGQSYDVLTPIQNALVAAQVAGGGRKVSLHLVEGAYDSNGQEIYRWKEPEGLTELPIDKNIMDTMRRAMVGVVAEAGGTAHGQSLRRITMGGKTGTAQVYQLDGEAVCRSEICRDHAWFIGFAPAENPELAAAVLVENGGFGASAAAPIMGEMFEKYFEK